MYLFTFLYPRPRNRAFGYEHHQNVHMPMGLALVKKHLGVQPEFYWIERIGENDPNSKEKYCAIVHLCFAKEEDRNRVLEMHAVSEAAQLNADYGNYTDAPPEVRLGRMVQVDDIPGAIAQHESASSS